MDVRVLCAVRLVYLYTVLSFSLLLMPIRASVSVACGDCVSFSLSLTLSLSFSPSPLPPPFPLLEFFASLPPFVSTLAYRAGSHHGAQKCKHGCCAHPGEAQNAGSWERQERNGLGYATNNASAPLSGLSCSDDAQDV